MHFGLSPIVTVTGSPGPGKQIPETAMCCHKNLHV